MDELWKTVLNELELEISKPTFYTFFKGTSLLEIKNSVAKIAAPTYINVDFIEKRYYSLIKKILDEKLKENISLVFISQAKPEDAKESPGPLFAKDVIKNLARPRPARVRPDYTFDSFAVSDSNQLAYTASQTIAKNPGSKYNPLFVYGTVGVGKTHLMNAIANYTLDTNEQTKILYLTTEEFTNEVVEAIRDRSTTNLRKKFRNLDLLLLDDIQFLSGKEKVQEELFHTFNTLIDRGAQIIFSSDRPPHEIKKIESRLASRFEGGLSVDVQPPDFELRAAILLIKAKKINLDIGLDLVKVIAEKITDTRALEGFLLRLSGESLSKNGESYYQIVQRLLSKKNSGGVAASPNDIIDTVCSFYKIKTTQLKGNRRLASLVLPRQVCMYLLKEAARLSLVEIGNLLGGRDHTTVIHGIEKIEKLSLAAEGFPNRIKDDLLSLKQEINTKHN